VSYCFRFHPNNVLKVRTLADSLGCFGLVADTNRYIAQYFPDITLSEDFLNLNISEVIDIVNKDELQASEEQVISIYNVFILINLYKSIILFRYLKLP